MGFEPTTSCSTNKRSNHWATSPRKVWIHEWGSLNGIVSSNFSLHTSHLKNCGIYYLVFKVQPSPVTQYVIELNSWCGELPGWLITRTDAALKSKGSQCSSQRWHWRLMFDVGAWPIVRLFPEAELRVYPWLALDTIQCDWLSDWIRNSLGMWAFSFAFLRFAFLMF